MTPRSPNQHPKTSTISRRLRTRADQNLSVQPSEIPQFRNVRPRRAATLPTRHLTSLKLDTPESHQDHQPSETAVTSIGAQGSDAVNLSRGAVSQHFHPVPSQSVDFAACVSLQASPGQGNAQGIHDFGGIQAERSHPSPSPLIAISDSHEFEAQLASDHIPSHTPFVDLQDMSTLGYMMAPSQYSMHHYGSPNSYSPNYPPNNHQGYAEHRSSTTGPYESSYAGGAILAHEQRRHDDHSVLPPYASQQPSLSRSPYQQQQTMGSMRSNSVPTASNPQNFAYSASHASIPNQPLGSNASTYPPPPLYPPTTYGVSDYHPLPTMYPPSSTTPAAYPSYEVSPGMNQPSPTQIPSLSSSPGAQSSAVMPRILNSRPKPQCWEHGCNGRQFSTFSNLLRHQREKSGTASKSYCPRCGAEFTRTTARNGHMAHDKCKPRRPSDADR